MPLKEGCNGEDQKKKRGGGLRMMMFYIRGKIVDHHLSNFDLNCTGLGAVTDILFDPRLGNLDRGFVVFQAA